MSLTPEFAPDAKSQWRALDLVLQELTLDQIEIMLHRAHLTDGLVYDEFAHDVAGLRHYIFLKAVVSRSRRKLTMIGVTHLTKPLADS